MLAGDLTAFGGERVDEPVAAQIRAEQLTLVLRHSRGMMLANAGNATVLAVALWNSPDGAAAALWGGIMVFGSVLSGRRARAAWKVTKPHRVSRGAIHRLVRNAFILGCLWAIVPLGFFARATNGGQLVITCLCAGMLAGGAFAFSTIPVAAMAMVAPIILGTGICLWQSGDSVHLLVAILVVVYAIVLFRAVFANSFEFARRLVALLETEKAVREDPLTHLSNRLAFNEGLEQALARLSRHGEEFAVLVLDLDRFKEVNDQMGHPAGDEFLIQIAARLRKCARETDTVARIGGDEYALVVTNVTRPSDALEAAERIVATFANSFHIEGREIIGSSSIGIVLAPRDGSTINDLLKHVDIALYRAKKAGPGTIRFFQPSDDALARERQSLQRDLETAIEQDQLFLVYQPFLNLRDNRVTGFEALLRWRHPVRGLVAPNEFIEIAEETELIHSIGEWVIRRACATLAQWPSDVRIAVNFSAAQFKNAKVLQYVVRALADAGVSPDRLEVEITESTSISRFASAESLVRSLTELGVTISLDDFGTGFASLTYLRKLPFSRIKIDQSFIREMLVRRDCEAIVKSIVRLAHDLCIDVVAEGVESQEQLDYLCQINCNEAQGYYIGWPMVADQALGLLDSQRKKAVRAA